jgi:hypothetical protein
MSYREHHLHHHPEVDGVPSLTKVRILNGVTSELVITCNYIIPAVAPATEDTLEPIHLTTEGYSDPIVCFEPIVEGLSATAVIDSEDDSIVRVVFLAECPHAVSEDAECDVSVLITNDGTSRTDCVLRGKLEIENSPLPAVG